MKIHKNMTNPELADLLNSIAAAYEIKDEKNNLFRIRAYQKAADAIEHLSSEAKDLWDDNELQNVAGIGKSISEHLGKIFKYGKSGHFNKVMSGIKPATFELMKISGIGPKTAHKLTDELNITSAGKAFDRLEKAGKKGEIGKLEGMGEDSQEAIIEAIKEARDRKDRLLLNRAEAIAKPIVDWMGEADFVESVEALGSLRRKASTVGDIDIAAASKSPQEVVQRFINYSKTKRVIEKGKREASIMIPGEIQVDLKVGDPETFGALLQHFTGSKHHNISLRKYAQKKNISLSEYGIKKGKKRFKTKTEKEFYKSLGMEWIPPELREASNEIQMALKNEIPKLVEIGDVKADLQIHSDFDIETSHDVGDSSMEDIIKKASELNYQYIAFTEHNPSQRNHSGSNIYDIIKRKTEKIEQLTEKPVKVSEKGVLYVYNSLEIDILPDGKLPVPQRALDLLDFALVSIHSSFDKSRKEMTKRIIRALDNPKVKIFAHPTARKLNHREGIEIDWDQLFDFCVKNNKWLEINADPMRLDLPDNKVKEAIDAGIKLTLGTDAHNKDSLDNMRFGVYVARRGWAQKKDIINTRTHDEFEKMLE